MCVLFDAVSMQVIKYCVHCSKCMPCGFYYDDNEKFAERCINEPIPKREFMNVSKHVKKTKADPVRFAIFEEWIVKRCKKML